MKPETLFISDLHLSANDPDKTRHFLKFVGSRTPGIDRLYILGDLFDAYIGDDDNSSPNREIKAALKHLSETGTMVFFQHGNRDFLVGDRFCRETGATLLGDWAVVDLYGEAVLLTHGDLPLHG
ncbi:MAG: UDP-2,3-diacylglucosamine diphosphatase [Comamonadaceae bacterium]|nr:UDP-2,3-diacylglucosamine diphosphatase [Comamonadaceae bacterium]